MPLRVCTVVLLSRLGESGSIHRLFWHIWALQQILDEWMRTALRKCELCYFHPLHFLSYIGSTLGLSHKLWWISSASYSRCLLHPSPLCMYPGDGSSVKESFSWWPSTRPRPSRDREHKSQGACSAAFSWVAFVLFVLFCFIFAFCQWPQLFPAVFLHSCMLQSAVADIPNSSRPRVGTALASNNPGSLYYPLLVPILQKPPLVAASQVLSLSEPSASC